MGNKLIDMNDIKKIMKKKVPLRSAVLYTLATEDSADTTAETTNEDVVAKLRLIYENEKQCSLKVINFHLEALRTSGLIVNTRNTAVNNTLVSYYAVTEQGYRRLKYLPKSLMA
ncbi:MAG: hypothetical protein HQK53_16065 [Oligoflexia bacterium]|nr:hypothetical protein [Oligoflexia bacterium]